jgi:hypothetical protein
MSMTLSQRSVYQGDLESFDFFVEPNTVGIFAKKCLRNGQIVMVK